MKYIMHFIKIKNISLNKEFYWGSVLLCTHKSATSCAPEVSQNSRQFGSQGPGLLPAKSMRCVSYLLNTESNIKRCTLSNCNDFILHLPLFQAKRSVFSIKRHAYMCVFHSIFYFSISCFHANERKWSSASWWPRIKKRRASILVLINNEALVMYYLNYFLY